MALKAAVSKRLGYDPFFPAARQTIVVEITDADDELQARMRLVDENGMIVGSRELREKAAQCDELVASLALAISIALDPSAALGEAPASAAPTARVEPPAFEAPPEAQRESVAREQPRKKSRPPATAAEASSLDRKRLQLAVRAAFFGDLGSAPAWGFGWRVGADLRRGGFSLAAEFAQQLPSSKGIAQEGRARASLLSGTLAPCIARDPLAGCGLLKLGALSTSGENIPYPSSQSSFYAALGARLEYAPTLFGKLQLLAQVDILKPLTPVSLHVRGAEVWSTPFFTFGAGVGLRLRFR